MHFRLRTLMIFLALGPMVLAVGYAVLQDARPSMHHTVNGLFKQMPAEDSQLSQWLRLQPNVWNVNIARRPFPNHPGLQHIQVQFEVRGTYYHWPPPPPPDVNAAF